MGGGAGWPETVTLDCFGNWICSILCLLSQVFLLCVDRDKEGEQEVFKQREEATEVKPVKVRRYPTPKDLI